MHLILIEIILATIIVAILAILIGDGGNQDDFKTSLLKSILRWALVWLIYFFLQIIGIYIDIEIISWVLGLLFK